MSLAIVVAAAGAGCAGDEFRLGGAGSTASGAGASGAAGPGGASSVGAGPSSSSGAGATGGTGPASSSAASASNASSAEASSSASSGAGGSAPVITIKCNGSDCGPGQVCCHDGDLPDGDFCASPGQCGQLSQAACGGPADCPGQICCMHVGGPQNFYEVSCVDNCQQGDTYLVMCNGDPDVCDNGLACHDSTWLGEGYFWCG